MSVTTRKAPYRHSDGSNCWTKNCRLKHSISQNVIAIQQQRITELFANSLPAEQGTKKKFINSKVLFEFNKQKGQEFWVEDNWGDAQEFIGGTLNKDTEWLFTNGQCLALAVGLSKAFGTDKVAIVTHVYEDDDIIYDDESGEEIPLLVEGPKHVYAVDKNGEYWDVYGNADPEGVNEAENITFVVPEGNEDRLEYKVEEGDSRLLTLSSNEAKIRFEGYLPNQDYEFAQSVVAQVVLRK